MRVGRALLAVASMVAVAVAAWALIDEAPEAREGLHALTVTGPDGELWNGTVAGSTPLALLLAAGEAGGFAVEVEGAGCQAYVRSIAGHTAEGAAGWIYAVQDAGEGSGAWRHPMRAAGCVDLGPGDAVRWRWTNNGTY